MKLTLIAVAGSALALSLSAHAEDMPGMKMDGMDMQQETTQAQVAQAEGTIKAMDTTKHTVTLAHGAVPAVQWPPMTMAFSATQDQLKGLTVGDHVKFSFRVDGGKATIVSIGK
ncbi:heat-shock protein HtpX [Pseudomonas putida]|uniref:Heat-shock protein HtpX n=1 Tax=Pseudomonas putida TaxID=303 RepID=A0A2Z4RTR0_PSEPU|nr:copper-binding protein [Pseudomonas putida]AWY44257.1 heat-shock protein HtpX [Pseudomonas putida]